MYSKGAFLNIRSPRRSEWEDQLAQRRVLETLGHLELWLEYVPTTQREFRHLHDMLNGLDLIVHAPFIGLSLATPWQDLAWISLERLKTVVDLADSLEAKVVTIHGGTYPEYGDRRQAVERVAQRLGQLIDSSDATVCVENMPSRPGATQEAFCNFDELEWLREIDPRARFTLDVGHAIQNGDDYIEFFATNSADIYNIHLHDGHRCGPAHQALFSGELDLPGFLAAMATNEYSKHLTLEVLSWDDTEKSWSALNGEESLTQ